MSSYDEQHASDTPTGYDSVTDAIGAIIRVHRAKNAPYEWGRHMESVAPVNEEAATRLFETESGSLPLKSAVFQELDDAISIVKDYYCHSKIRAILERWAAANWSVVAEGQREAALHHCVQPYYSPDLDPFRNLVTLRPRLAVDPLLRTSIIQEIVLNNISLDTGIKRLLCLHGDQASSLDVLKLAITSSRSDETRNDIASLIAQWAGVSVWGRLQYLIWSGGRGTKCDQAYGNESVQKIFAVVKLLREFGIRGLNDAGYKLSELSAESISSWRRQLKNVIGKDYELRHCTAEALLWFAAAKDDHAVLFTVLELYDHDQDEYLKILLDHPDNLVVRRATAIIGMIQGEPDTMSVLLSRRSASVSTVSEAHDGFKNARTWLNDARIELLVESTINQAAAKVGRDVNRTLDSGEETHVTHLLTSLSFAFESISKELAALAAETKENEWLSFTLDHRIVGKPEEGKPGVGSKRFSTDVCIIFEARDSGKTFAHRASLVQAKRLFRRDGKKSILDHYLIKKAQLHDLAEQTMASFVMLVGPECDGVTMPVIPARLMHDLIERGQQTTQLSPAKASRLGKGIGTWLIEDIIGMWTGDWSEKIVLRAKGGTDREPYILATVIVDRVRRGRDER